jgi:hypothetical protein
MEGEFCGRSDLAGSKIAWLVWGVPTGAILLGACLAPPARLLLWSPSFLVTGAACLLNAARCGRLHCHLTGPLFLLAAAATVAVGLGWVPLSWGWIGWAALGGTVLAFAAEWLAGQYVARA